MTDEQLLSAAMLMCTDVTSTAAGVVKFDFNPTKITMSRQSMAATPHVASPNTGTTHGAGGAGGVSPTPPAPAAPARLTITMSELVFYGMSTQADCDKLLSWGQFAARILPLPMPVISSRPPVLTFVWGPPVGGFTLDVTMTKCEVVYERFLPTGMPVRAKVSLTLQEHATRFPGTNPTSGGVPGRGAHVLIAGESLQSLALAYYGSERAWRRIAEANDIDDPLRVAAGRGLYLPSAEPSGPGAGR